ncbi:Uncharacterized protein Nst1_055 [Candidatus Nanobsidianus stetteri]|uniref:Uncharacterized protein n=1 Tax=Nanobsidianus stetteri TaxID=1294122 RepID=R1G3K5_NANST|nr:Uncharacterized protein Nst1_055 [Candidatus Nanobsidianus stetteri]
MTSYIYLRARVYHTTRDGSLYNIHAYVESNRGREKERKFFTLQTEKEIPKIIFEKYRKIKDDDKYYFPKVFIVPAPPIRKNETTIPFYDKFKLVIIYAKDPPYRIRLDKLFKVSNMEIYVKKDKLRRMYVEGSCEPDALDALINNNNLESKSYNIDLREANLDDLLKFIRYDVKYNSKNNQNNRNEEMEKTGPYIFIGKDKNLSCKQSYIAPRDIKILEIYRIKT